MRPKIAARSENIFFESIEWKVKSENNYFPFHLEIIVEMVRACFCRANENSVLACSMSDNRFYAE